MSRPLAIVLLGSVCFVCAATLKLTGNNGWGWLMLVGAILAIML